MNVFGRYILYLADCLVMLFAIGIQLILLRGQWPLSYDFDNWLPILLGGSGGVGVVTLIGGTVYWYIVDYHEELQEVRRSRVVSLTTGGTPPTEKRFLRSFLKAFTLFTAPFLLLFAVFSTEHRFLHDYVAKTERVRY